MESEFELSLNSNVKTLNWARQSADNFRVRTLQIPSWCWWWSFCWAVCPLSRWFWLRWRSTEMKTSTSTWEYDASHFYAIRLASLQANPGKYVPCAPLVGREWWISVHFWNIWTGGCLIWYDQLQRKENLHPRYWPWLGSSQLFVSVCTNATSTELYLWKGTRWWSKCLSIQGWGWLHSRIHHWCSQRSVWCGWNRLPNSLGQMDQLLGLLCRGTFFSRAR